MPELTKIHIESDKPVSASATAQFLLSLNGFAVAATLASGAGVSVASEIRRIGAFRRDEPTLDAATFAALAALSVGEVSNHNLRLTQIRIGSVDTTIEHMIDSARRYLESFVQRLPSLLADAYEYRTVAAPEYLQTAGADAALVGAVLVVAEAGARSSLKALGAVRVIVSGGDTGAPSRTPPFVPM